MNAKNNIFGNYIRRLRISQNKTLKKVSIATNRSIGYIADLEHGRRPFPARSPDFILLLSTYYNVPASNLLEKAGLPANDMDERTKNYFNLIKKRAAAVLIAEGMTRLERILLSLEQCLEGNTKALKTVKMAQETVSGIDSNLQNLA